MYFDRIDFSGTIFLLAPVDVFVANVDEFAISGRDLVPALTICFVFTALALSLFFLVAV